MFSRTLLLFLLCLINNTTSASYKVTDQIFFDIDSGGKYLGRMVIGLFGEVVPKTALNFKQIATNGINGRTYEGSRFHRVIERFLIQGGDIVHNNGSGSVSVYGKFFNDENFEIPHNGPGIVGMASQGNNSNGCQFYITTLRTPWLDGNHVAFGKVISGQDVVHRIEHVKTDSDDIPTTDVVIVRSGLIKTTPFYEPVEPYELTLWAWIKAGWFPLSFSIALILMFQWFMVQLKY